MVTLGRLVEWRSTPMAAGGPMAGGVAAARPGRPWRRGPGLVAPVQLSSGETSSLGHCDLVAAASPGSFLEMQSPGPPGSTCQVRTHI